MYSSFSIRGQICPDPHCNSQRCCVHSRKYKRLRCADCGRTWSARPQVYRSLRHDDSVIDAALSQMMQGQSMRSVAREFGVSLSTIRRWKRRVFTPSPLCHGN